MDNSTILSQRELLMLAEAIERALKEYDGVLNKNDISGRQYSHLLCLQTELNFMFRWVSEKAKKMGIEKLERN